MDTVKTRADFVTKNLELSGQNLQILPTDVFERPIWRYHSYSYLVR